MSIRIFKFGGASIRTADGVRNVASIIGRFAGEPLLVVISAMGKTTNALETVLRHYIDHDPVLLIEAFEKVRTDHLAIVRELFPDPGDPVYGVIGSLFDQLRGTIRRGHLYRQEATNFDMEYDQIVSFGELISTAIVYHFLRDTIPDVRLMDVREMIKTDSTWRDARVDWEETTRRIRERLQGAGLPGSVILTQGFLGSDTRGQTTTLGREGSDFSAAIFAYALKASEMTIWKDVPGVMNADPRWMPDAVAIETLSYREAVELAYYGASVIHPKTIRPLENANIRLHVKSFIQPELPGTQVEQIHAWTIPFPIYIRKQKQVLISLSARDFSFILEENLSDIFRTLSQFRVKVNVMHNSAISFSVCVDDDERKIAPLLGFLDRDYEVRYNHDLELITIRHYTDESVERLCKNRTVLMELRSRGTVQMVVR